QVAAAAQIRGRTHAIEQERVFAVMVVRVVRVLRGIDQLERHVTALELREQWLEPVRVLVVDADWALLGRRHAALGFWAWLSRRRWPESRLAIGDWRLD